MESNSFTLFAEKFIQNHQSIPTTALVYAKWDNVKSKLLRIEFDFIV